MRCQRGFTPIVGSAGSPVGGGILPAMRVTTAARHQPLRVAHQGSSGAGNNVALACRSAPATPTRATFSAVSRSSAPPPNPDCPLLRGNSDSVDPDKARNANAVRPHSSASPSAKSRSMPCGGVGGNKLARPERSRRSKDQHVATALLQHWVASTAGQVHHRAGNLPAPYPAALRFSLLQMRHTRRTSV